MLYCYLAVKKVAGIGTIWDLISHEKLDSTINLIPFSSEGFATYILNIIMFMPLGFLLPLIWRRYREMGRTVLTGFCMSLSIELSQLFCLRVTDIDDLTMNTLGTAVGFGCWMPVSESRQESNQSQQRRTSGLSVWWHTGNYTFV